MWSNQKSHTWLVSPAPKRTQEKWGHTPQKERYNSAQNGSTHNSPKLETTSCLPREEWGNKMWGSKPNTNSEGRHGSISKILHWTKGGRHKRLHTVWLYPYELQEQAGAAHGNKSQHSTEEGRGTDWEGTWVPDKPLVGHVGVHTRKTSQSFIAKTHAPHHKQTTHQFFLKIRMKVLESYITRFELQFCHLPVGL